MKYSKFPIKVSIALLAGAIALSSTESDYVTRTYADSSVIQQSYLSSFDLDSYQTVYLSDVNSYPEGDNNRVTFTLTIYNNSSQEFDFVDYWVRLGSTSGKTYNVNLLTQDKEKFKIAANSSTSLSFYSNVGNDVALQDLLFKMIRWDFNVEGYERSLGTMQVPEGYSQVTPAEQSRVILLNRLHVESLAKEMKVTKRDKSSQVKINILMKNTDRQALKLPELQYSLLTANGLVYPLQVTGLIKDVQIQPLEEKEGTLLGSIPNDVSLEAAQLVITKVESINNQNITLPVGYYELKQKKGEDKPQSKEGLFTTNDGTTYSYAVQNIHRVPWEDQDILLVDLTITNKESEILTIPKLTAYLKLDETIKIDAKAVKMDKIIGLDPGQSMNIQLVGKVPYTYRFKKINAILQETEGEGDKATVTDLIDIGLQSDEMDLEINDVGQAYKFQAVGRNASYKVKDIQRFSSDTDDYLDVRVEIDNLEKRKADINKLIANFLMPDGSSIPAELTEIKEKMLPNGKALLHFNTVIPKQYDLKGSQLLIGQAVAADKLAENEDKPDAYVKPVSFILPEEDKTVLKNLDSIGFEPYTLKLNRFTTSLLYDQNKIMLDFDYELSKNMLAVTNPVENKILIEMVDPVGHVDFKQTFDLEKGDQALLLGKHTIKTSTVEENLILDISKLKKYTINVYHILQVKDGDVSHKRLLATKNYDWFIISD